MKTKISQKGFFFDGENDKHDYYFDGKKMTGITTILQILAKPALISWAANEVVKNIKENAVGLKDFIVGLTTKPKIEITNPEFFGEDKWIVNNEILENARVAHCKKKEKAGEKGTDIHAEIEGLIKIQIEIANGYFVGLEVPGRTEQVRHFVDWATQNKVKFLESEKQLYSEKMWIAGTCDFVCEIDGKVWLGDIKTSSAIYPEHFAQCAGYQLMIEENKLYEIAGHIIVNLRKDGTFEEKRSISLGDYQKFFLACLEIYRIQEKIKGQIINNQ